VITCTDVQYTHSEESRVCPVGCTSLFIYHAHMLYVYRVHTVGVHTHTYIGVWYDDETDDDDVVVGHGV